MTRLAIASARITRVDSADGPGLIELHGEDGSTGIGESPASTLALSALAHLCASLIGMDAVRTTAIREQLVNIAREQGIGTPMVGAVECAVWDLLARHLGAPLHALLGTSRRQPVVAPGIVCMDRSNESVDELVERARTLVQARGHKALLLMIPNEQLARAALAVREVRGAFGAAMRIRVECSRERDAADVQSLLEHIDDLDIDYVANAVTTFTGQGSVRRVWGTPLAGTIRPDEGLATWVEASTGEVIIGDATSWGGVAQFRKHAAVCRAFSIDLAVRAADTLGPAVGMSLQLIASHSVASKGFHGIADSFTRAAVVTPQPVVQNGLLAIPEGPGIGWSLDPARLSARVFEQAVITSPAARRT